MNRSQFIEALTRRSKQLSLADTKAAVDTIIAALTEALAAGGRAEIRGFGTFRLNYRPPRIARNPMTGALVKVPAKAALRFKMAKALQARVDKKLP